MAGNSYNEELTETRLGMCLELQMRYLHFKILKLLCCLQIGEDSCHIYSCVTRVANYNKLSDWQIYTNMRIFDCDIITDAAHMYILLLCYANDLLLSVSCLILHI